ncbi:MAG: hypothetical protein AAGF95_27600 [Chloroflexota bacterium]
MHNQKKATPQIAASRIDSGIISLPDGYEQVDERFATQDEVAVCIKRHERTDGRNRGLGGEHVTTVTDTQTGQLKGITWMDTSFVDRPLANREEAQQVAETFLANVAPDLTGTLTILWIEPHDETLMADDKTTIVTCMKVKCRQASGNYAWVIVGSEERVMTFERDIVWNTDMSVRTTEKWLHDSWLAAQAFEATT